MPPNTALTPRVVEYARLLVYSDDSVSTVSRVLLFALAVSCPVKRREVTGE